MTSDELISRLPTFTVSSAGGRDMLAALTVQSANQSFPFLAVLLKRLGVPELQVLGVDSFVHSDAARHAVQALEKLFIHHGSDKAGGHDYHQVYGAILASPTDIRAVCEIGLGTNNEDVASNMGRHGRPGASLRAFRDFLPNAQIFGADVDKRILFTEERIQTFHVDQTDLHSIEQLAAQLPMEFDLIIDDGLHAPNANIAALIFGLGKLRRGGCLVVEDIHPDHVPVWQVISALLPDTHRKFLVAARGGLLFVIQRN